MDIQGITFGNERSKLKDMKLLTMKEFLESYSYLTVDDYLATTKELLSRISANYWEAIVLNKIITEMNISNEVKKTICTICRKLY